MRQTLLAVRDMETKVLVAHRSLVHPQNGLPTCFQNGTGRVVVDIRSSNLQEICMYFEKVVNEHGSHRTILEKHYLFPTALGDATLSSITEAVNKVLDSQVSQWLSP